LAPKKYIVRCFLLLVFIGIPLTQLGGDFFKEFESVKAYAKTLEILSKMIGSALLASAAYLAFRKLPAGN
jgi:hypothetical protein